MTRLRTRAIATVVLVVVLTLSTARGAIAVYRGSDPFDNVMPNPFITSPDADKYPIGAYELDYHVDVNVLKDKSWFAGAAQWFCAQMWDFLSHAGMLIIDAISWAFSVNFITGPNGMLPAIHQATLYLHEHVIDQRYIVIAIGMLGVWGGFKALSSPTEVVSTFITSLCCTLLVLSLIYNPTGLFGTMVNMTNDVSAGVMSTLDPSTDADNGQRAARDHLHEMIIKRPWTVLEFGGLQHCVDMGDLDADGFPRNVSRFARTKGDRVCRDHTKSHNGYGGYADRFLAQPPGSIDRDQEYESIKDGQIHVLCPNPPQPCTNQAKQFDGYRVDKADAPAVDIMQEGGAGHRLTMTAIILIGMVGILALLARMVGVMLAAGIAALALLAFAPVILLFGIVPAGHPIFKWWLKSLMLATFMKLILAVMLVVLLVVSMAMSAALTYVDYMVVFAVQAGFYWLIYKKRQTIIQAFGGAAAQGMNRRGLSVAGVYSASRPYRALSRSFSRHNKKVGIGKKAGAGAAAGAASGSGNQTRGSNESPEDQETAVGGNSHDFALGTKGGKGSATVNAANVQVQTSGKVKGDTATQPGTNGRVGGAQGTPTKGEGAKSGQATPNGARQTATPVPQGSQPGNGTPKPPNTPEPTTHERMTETYNREQAERNYRWATVDIPQEVPEPAKLHEESMWRLDRKRNDRDAFGRDLPKPVDPPPPPKDSP